MTWKVVGHRPPRYQGEPRNSRIIVRWDGPTLRELDKSEARKPASAAIAAYEAKGDIPLDEG